VNDGLKGSGGVGLFRERTRFFDAGEITHQYRACARDSAHCLLGTLLVAPMQDDVMP
jgi:hypothetical protein